MTPARPATRTRSLAWLAGIALAFALLVALSEFSGPVPEEIRGSGSFISARYDPPTSGVEVGLDLGDGQLFATHAADPFLDQPSLIRGGPEEQAYRFQRPLYGWLGWLVSGGQPGAVPWAVVALTIASVVALVAGAARILRDRGADPRYALVLLATPGVLADLQRVGPEALGTLLVLVGAVTWVARSDRSPFWRGGAPHVASHRAGRGSCDDGAPPRRFLRGGAPWAARERAGTCAPPGLVVPIACFAAAGLCRETLLLVAAALLLHDLVRSDTAGRRRALAAGAAIVAPYVGWVLALRAILGAWPSGTVDGRLSLVPFAGLIEAAGSRSALDAVFVVAILAGAIGALARPAEAWMRWVIAGHLALAATLGEPVWASWRDWGRVLLPMTAITLVSLATRTARATVASCPGEPTTSLSASASEQASPVC